MNPLYFEANMYATSGTKHSHEQTIYDEATQTEYDLDPAAYSDEQWHQAQIPESVFWLPVASLDYLHMTNATLVGTEHLDGVAVWHIRGTLKYLLSFSGDIDVYLRQDTYLPVEMVIHEVTQGTGTQEETFQYTSFNTGLAIRLPAHALSVNGF